MQADAHVTTAVAQVERMSMALRAISNNRYFFGLNQRQVCVVVVINLGHLSLLETFQLEFIKPTVMSALPTTNYSALRNRHSPWFSFRATSQLVRFWPFQEFQTDEELLPKHRPYLLCR